VRVVIFAAIAATAIVLTGTPVLAASCTSLEPECIGYGGSSNTTTPEAKRKQCQAATSACKAQCAKGVKTYISPFTGKQYVVDSCK
jgi:hypothetical protein